MPRQEFVALPPGFAIGDGTRISSKANPTPALANVMRLRIDIKPETPFLSAKQELLSKGPT